jgi:hypothetical protein
MSEYPVKAAGVPIMKCCNQRGCMGVYEMTDCGKVCNECNDHDGLVRCFCGWSRSGGDGRQELIEMGERIDEDDL